jgi:ferredoxin
MPPRRHIAVDRELCEGHAQCEIIAPEVFKVGDDDQSHAHLDPVPDRLAGEVENAIAACPRGALSWSDHPQA